MKPLNPEKAKAKALGLKRYSDGRPCKRGHVGERFIEGGCVECARLFQPQYKRTYREKNLERVRATDREKYWQNRPVKLAQMRERASTKEYKLRQKERSRVWWAKTKIALEIIKQLDIKLEENHGSGT